MKNKMFKSMTTVALAAIMVAGSIVPVLAVVDETQNASNGTSCEVLYNLDSDGLYTVTIPKKITLGSDKTASYNVTVAGDISSDKQVTVVPDASFEMVDQNGGKDNVTATVTHATADTIWVLEEIAVKDGESVVGTTKSGSIAAPGLSAGEWKGTFNFTIGFGDKQ
jgi:hypothetical protein